MTQATAQTLIPGQKIIYWDGRIATVTKAATMPEVLPPPSVNVGSDIPYITISFDADINPKPLCQIKANDFMRAELMT